MKKNILVIGAGFLVLASGCNNSSESEAPVSDTVTKVVEVPISVPTIIDSAAITAAYEEEHAKTKSTNTNKHKKHGTKLVMADSHTPIPHHDTYFPQPAPAATASAPAETKVIVVHDKEYIYYTPDENPKFIGGEKAFDEFIINNVNYPEDALQRNIQGTVFTVVYLDEVGNVSKVEFPGKQLGFGLEEETRRIMMTCPRWMPARHGGQTVKSKITIPVTYKIMD